MCGRYALALRASEVRRHLQESHMPSDEAPDDDATRQTYNFAPGYHGLVYRADTPDGGAGPSREQAESEGGEGTETHGKQSAAETVNEATVDGMATQETKYKLQAMKWGLVPFWTKRNPDYGSMLRTINCRDDSLASNGGMWNTMKQKKRCIIVCQGFYEWLKKDGSKNKIPHFVKRKDGQLMCFAGLWDCAKFEGSNEKLYTYSIITTDSNKQLKFLHDRMPVVLDNGSEELRTWLDPNRYQWSKELQSLLKPYQGELECYPVSKEVGKVGNNSPSFIVPIDSTENKSNIANFFGVQKKAATKEAHKKEFEKEEREVENKGYVVKQEAGETRQMTNEESTEDNAPLPAEPSSPTKPGIKREHEGVESGEDDPPPRKTAKNTSATNRITSARKLRSATSNGTATKDGPKKTARGSKKITNFLNK